ncbi:MAG: hypothetical protein HRU33_22495 [Rhodobacteraceae bacterium]|nr:hypothetical protein [Paracoccaceae bacterium]
MEPIGHPVSRYATGVIEGDIVAGDLVRMACERHLVDLETGADRGLYFDCEAAPQGNCAATTKNQAGLLFREMKRMIKRSAFLKEFMDVSRTAIETARTDRLIAGLSRDGDSSDGINPSFLARDEMHRWTDRELADAIVESMIARAQSIGWVSAVPNSSAAPSGSNPRWRR